jgi:hypothetical protein
MLRNWLRSFVRDSVLAGVENAVQTLAGEQVQEDRQTGELVSRLRLRLLAGPEPEAPVKVRRKAE